MARRLYQTEFPPGLRQGFVQIVRLLEIVLIRSNEFRLDRLKRLFAWNSFYPRLKQMLFVIREIEAYEQPHAPIRAGFIGLRILRRISGRSFEFELQFITETKSLFPSVDAMPRLLCCFFVLAEVENQEGLRHTAIL